MNFPYPSLAIVLVASNLASSAPPSTFEFGGTAPEGMGGHLAYAFYPGENGFIQMRLEEGVINLHPRGVSMLTAVLGVGYEEELTSHSFFRLTAANGIGLIYNAGPTPADLTERLGSFRLAPELLWFPLGRFTGPSLGLNIGMNLQYRYSYTDKPLPNSLSKTSLQIFAGFVL